MTISDVYRKYIDEFEKNNIGELSLRILLCHIYHFDYMEEFILNKDKSVILTKEDERLIKKCIKGIPVQYLINEATFYNMNFFVNSHVLIPRPETEELVYESILRINKLFYSYQKSINIYDYGTGSGVIAISIDKTINLSHTTYAIDNSILALLVANKNKKKLNSNVRVEFGNILKYRPNGKINVLISNPPYIENENEIDDNVKKYEPKSALIAKPGTLFYFKILENCRDFLDDKFIICFEIGYDLKNALTEFLNNDDFYINHSIWEFKKDMEGKDRFLFITSK